VRAEAVNLAGEVLRGRLAQALTQDPRRARRLGRAATSVALDVREDDGSTTRLSLLLERPPELLPDPEPGEVTVELTAAQALAFAGGELSLPPEALVGAVGCSGPVRRFMAVEPVLRSLLRDAGPNAGWTTERPARPEVAFPEPTELLAVETRGLRKSFGKTQVLAGLDLKVPEGAVSVVMGPSGTGKSVLLKHIIGLLAPDDGDVLVRGRALSRMSSSEALALRRDVGVMFQDGALFSSMNLFDNVAFPLRQHTDLREDEVRHVVAEQLAAVGLANAGAKLPSEISGGMRKRAGLARSLVLDPGIVLCDEPDSGLDPVRTALLGELLIDRHAELGGTMIIVTHNLGLARLVADHATVAWRGQVVETGPADDVWASEHPFVRQFLAGAVDGPLDMEG
jgi:phospholipid/cholesterol/gamma-HCH transport system ATP-binding protein